MSIFQASVNHDKLRVSVVTQCTPQRIVIEELREDLLCDINNALAHDTKTGPEFLSESSRQQQNACFRAGPLSFELVQLVGDHVGCFVYFWEAVVGRELRGAIEPLTRERAEVHVFRILVKD